MAWWTNGRRLCFCLRCLWRLCHCRLRPRRFRLESSELWTEWPIDHNRFCLEYQLWQPSWFHRGTLRSIAANHWYLHTRIQKQLETSRSSANSDQHNGWHHALSMHGQGSKRRLLQLLRKLILHSLIILLKPELLTKIVIEIMAQPSNYI